MTGFSSKESLIFNQMETENLVNTTFVNAETFIIDYRGQL